MSIQQMSMLFLVIIFGHVNAYAAEPDPACTKTNQHIDKLSEDTDAGMALDALKKLQIPGHCSLIHYHYGFGVSYLKTKNYRKAYRAFKQAYSEVKGEEITHPLGIDIVARLAQSLWLREKRVKANTEAEFAHGLYAQTNRAAPSWFVELLTQIDYFMDSADSRYYLAALEDAYTTPKGASIVKGINIRVLFDTNKAVIKPAGIKQIDELATAIVDSLSVLERDQKTIVILGHTDIKGDDAINEPLSQARADAVRKRILMQYEHQYPALARHVKAIGRGSSDLRYQQNSTRYNALNRRVEIKIH